MSIAVPRIGAVHHITRAQPSGLASPRTGSAAISSMLMVAYCACGLFSSPFSE